MQVDTNVGRSVVSGQKSKIYAQQNSAKINTLPGLLYSKCTAIRVDVSLFFLMEWI